MTSVSCRGRARSGANGRAVAGTGILCLELKVIRQGADDRDQVIGSHDGAPPFFAKGSTEMPNVKTSSLSRRALRAASLAVAVAALAPAAASAATSNDQTQFSVTAGSLSFSSAPAMPGLTGVTLNGQAQTTNTTMTNFAVQDATGSGAGWNVTVNGNSAGGKSPVFKQYCPVATCGTDSGPGYVTGGQTLAANSLTLNSTGASFTAQNGSTGTGPTVQCGSACNVDSASAVKVASAALSAGMGTWGTTGWSGTSLALSTPTTLKTLQPSEVYRADLVWTLNTGP
ncbi:MAG: WxL domain-containing protein [Solirubrobacteraceae bacterium]